MLSLNQWTNPCKRSEEQYNVSLTFIKLGNWTDKQNKYPWNNQSLCMN